MSRIDMKYFILIRIISACRRNYKSSKVRIRKTKIFITRNKYRLNIETQKEIIAKLFCTQYSHAMQNNNYPLSLFLANLHKTHFSFCCQRPLFLFHHNLERMYIKESNNMQSTKTEACIFHCFIQ